MVWRPSKSIAAEELREARAALADGQKFVKAAYGPLGLVRLSDLSGGNSIALRLLHEAMGYKADRVHKRVAASAMIAALRVLDGLATGQHEPTDSAETETRHDSEAGPVAQKPDTTMSIIGKPASQPQGKVSYWRQHPEASEKPRRTKRSTDIIGARIVLADASDAKDSATQRESDQVRPSSNESDIEVRRFTAEGIARAREFLAHMREHPRATREPPRELLFGDRYSQPLRESVRVGRRPLRTRRDAAEYFVPKFESIRHLVVDDARLWSWLGMFYFADTVRVENGEARLSPLDETFVVHREDSRSYMLRFRHYLWGSWRLYETHGESVTFLLDQNLTSFGDIFQRTFGAIRIFNSDGIIQLVLRLYTHGMRQKRGFGRAPGGLRHLLRVLDQLERTYDIYGMSPDALLTVLPEEFQRWDNGSAQRTLDGEAEPNLVAGGVEPSPASTAGGPAHSSTGSPRTDVPVPQASGFPPQGESSSESDELSRPRPSVRQTLLDVRARIEQQGQVSWADPRELLEEGSEAWEAYVAVCGVPERRLFRTAFLHRLNEVLASLD